MFLFRARRYLDELSRVAPEMLECCRAALAAFRVIAVRQSLKTRFPTAAVYGPAPVAELRLVTCGGTFDYATGHYLSNVIVFAIAVRWHHRAAPRG